MRIGIDLDGVIFDSEKLYKVYSELYDVQELKRNSLINNKSVRFQDRYNWNETEIEGFIKKYHRRITEYSNFMPGVKEVVTMLKQEGNTLIVITARGKKNEKLIPLTIERLKENNLDIFDKYYWSIENKVEICKKEQIDLMIDDYDVNCEDLANNNIKTIYFKDTQSPDLKERENLKILYNWGEIYRYIKQILIQ